MDEKNANYIHANRYPVAAAQNLPQHPGALLARDDDQHPTRVSAKYSSASAAPSTASSLICECVFFYFIPASCNGPEVHGSGSADAETPSAYSTV